jgi:hypothetical protein
MSEINSINSINNLPEIKDKPKGTDEWVKAADFRVRNDFTMEKYQDITWLYSEYRKVKLDNLMTCQDGVIPDEVRYYINNKNEIRNITVVNYYGDNIIVDGNYRATAARILGWKEIKAEYVNYEDAKSD